MGTTFRMVAGPARLRDAVRRKVVLLSMDLLVPKKARLSVEYWDAEPALRPPADAPIPPKVETTRQDLVTALAGDDVALQHWEQSSPEVQTSALTWAARARRSTVRRRRIETLAAAARSGHLVFARPTGAEYGGG